MPHACERLARRREGRGDIAVGIDGEQRAPAPVLREPQRRVRQTGAIEADRRDIADLAAEPPLEDTKKNRRRRRRRGRAEVEFIIGRW